MENHRVSLTALVSAYIRAYHATYDHPKIFDDFLAAQLFTQQENLFLGHNLALSLSFFDPELAASYPDEASALARYMRIQTAALILSRARYTEDSLDQAIAEGVAQYVILGAGLDTFAFRRREQLGELQVLEVDHPATQADKRRRLAGLGWVEPAGLHWIPADFAEQDLAAVLQDSPYDPQKRAFFSWLGVTYYLTRAQVFRTLRAIAALSPSGSPIIFDYFEADAFIPERAGRRAQRAIEITKNAGEPMKTGFDPSTLPVDLAGVGLKLVRDLGPGDLQALYFDGRTDGYHAFEQAHLALAAVA